MNQLITHIGGFMALRGVKRNQHYIDMDGVKMYYETIKQPGRSK